MRRAFLRYLTAPSLQDTLALAEKERWDAWTAPEIVRFLVYMFVIAGGAAPSFLLSAIVKKLHDDPSLLPIYKENKRKFILEIARLERCVPLVNFMAHEFGDVTIFNERLRVPKETPIHCSIQNANRDGK